MGKRKKIVVTETPIVFESEGSQLVGMLHSANAENIVILCHGFTGNKSENKRLFVEAAREFALNKMDAFRFDFFGSGDSDGEFADTTISHNIQNLRDAIHLMREKGYKKVAVLGLSMGGATAILNAPSNNVDLLVTWSSVPDMKILFENYVGNLPHDVPDLDVHEYEGWEVKRSFWEDGITHDVMAALECVTNPKLIVQGTEDSPLFVKGFHAFRDVVLPPADFMEIPDAGHTFQTPKHRRQVIRQTLIWLKRKFEQN
jgi:uncharacterized protein